MFTRTRTAPCPTDARPSPPAPRPPSKIGVCAVRPAARLRYPHSSEPRPCFLRAIKGISALTYYDATATSQRVTRERTGHRTCSYARATVDRAALPAASIPKRSRSDSRLPRIVNVAASDRGLASPHLAAPISAPDDKPARMISPARTIKPSGDTGRRASTVSSPPFGPFLFPDLSRTMSRDANAAPDWLIIASRLLKKRS